MIAINGLSLPAPGSLSVQVEPKGGSGQYNALGQWVMDGGVEKRTVEISWPRMSGALLGDLSLQLRQGGFFTLSYPDPLSGSREMRCRLVRQRARVWRYQNETPLWADVYLMLEEE